MLRVNYVFMNRYMVTASIRADGSSRLVDNTVGAIGSKLCI